METYKYVIIGGGLAGGRACENVRRVDAAGSIALVAGEPRLPYQRPPLSKGYLTGKEGLDKVYLKEEAFYAQNKIAVISGVRATKLDRAARQVTLADGRVLGYEKLLLATGAQARRLPIAGSDLPGVCTLRTIDDADAIRAVATAGVRALVVGGSFIGCEVAASLAQLGVAVTMAFLETRLLERVVTAELSEYIARKYTANGVRILPKTRPTAFVGSSEVQQAMLDNGETLPVDLVVMGVGVKLDTVLAREAGLEMDGDAILVDEYLRTSDPNIYAAGDIAAWPDAIYGKRLRVEHWDVARAQGLRAGRNMAGELKPYATLPYFFSDLFDLSFEVWGDLTTWDQTVLRGAVRSGSFACYYFAQGRMVGVLAANRPDAERKPMQKLVQMRPAYANVAARLSDESTDLNIVAG